MSSKIKTNQNLLVCTSFPKGIIILIMAFYLLFILAIFNTDQTLEIIDYFIFHGVLFIGVSIQQHITTSFNITTKEVKITKKGLFNKKIIKLKFDDIKSIEMSYGKGSGYASGGSIVITTIDKRIVIASSDIDGRATKNKNNLKIINSFLKNK